ncbi:branched-chain amino acid ABC transporter permease [Bradyrhizobium sp. dw_411]|uniref:branched-chain amino acid ABC transporter permease n=1 Tax=Bradyrhizobium sp. dw_411 TaxID=2720082 RepID=UPI001BD07A5D
MLQDLASGLIMGLAYASIAVGLSLIFGVLRIINFAHGEFYMLGGLILYSLTNGGISFFPALAGAVLGTMLLAAVIDRLVLKPLRRKDDATIALATLGISIFLANTGLVLWGPVPHNIPTSFSTTPLILPGSVYLSRFELFTAALTLVAIVGLHLVLQRTSAGRQIRAVVQDRDAAALVGLDVDRIYTTTFAVGCGLAALSGGLLGSMFLVYPSMGLAAVLKAFVVVVIGGMGSLGGAVAGGILLGVTESLSGAWMPPGFKDIIGFVFIILVLAVRPQGIFGIKQVRIR